MVDRKKQDKFHREERLTILVFLILIVIWFSNYSYLWRGLSFANMYDRSPIDALSCNGFYHLPMFAVSCEAVKPATKIVITTKTSLLTSQTKTKIKNMMLEVDLSLGYLEVKLSKENKPAPRKCEKISRMGG